MPETGYLVDNSESAMSTRLRRIEAPTRTVLKELVKLPTGTEILNTPFELVKVIDGAVSGGRPNYQSRIFGVPICSLGGELYDPHWYQDGSKKFVSGLAMCTVSQDKDWTQIFRHTGDVRWKAIVRWDTGGNIPCLSGPYIPTWSVGGVLEWDYGWMKRRLHLCSGGLSEEFIVHDVPPSIPPSASELIIDTTPISNTGIEFNPPYIVVDGRPPLSALCSAVPGLKRIPVSILMKENLPLVIDDSATFYTDTGGMNGDGYVKTTGSAGESWDSVRDTEDADEVDATGVNCHARVYTEGTGGSKLYEIQRAGLSYDTSGLDDAAVISAAKIRYYVSILRADGSSGGVWGDDTSPQVYPHSPMQVADYDRYEYSDSGDSKASHTNDAWNEVNLGATAQGWVDKTGTTRFCIREKDHDADDSAPGDETDHGFGFRSHEYDSGSVKPELVITYSVPSAFVPRIVIV